MKRFEAKHGGVATDPGPGGSRPHGPHSSHTAPLLIEARLAPALSMVIAMRTTIAPLMLVQHVQSGGRAPCRVGPTRPLSVGRLEDAYSSAGPYRSARALDVRRRALRYVLHNQSLYIISRYIVYIRCVPI